MINFWVGIKQNWRKMGKHYTKNYKEHIYIHSYTNVKTTNKK